MQNYRLGYSTNNCDYRIPAPSCLIDQLQRKPRRILLCLVRLKRNGKIEKGKRSLVDTKEN